MKSVTLPVDLLLHAQRALDLELEHADPALGGDPVDLGAQRAVAAADELDVLEELARLDPGDELLLAQEPVLAAVLLAGPLRPRRRRDGDLELREPLDEPLDQRPLAGPDGPVTTKTGSGRA